MTLLVIAVRPLVVSEDAAEGSGLLFVLLAFLPLGFALLETALREGRIQLHAATSDFVLVAFLAWLTVATWLAPSRGPALNLLCEWFALALVYWAARALVFPRYGKQATIAWLVGLAAALACYAGYQAFWGLEQLRRDFARDPEMVLRTLGIVPGSPQEQAFLNRLNSHEAFATFALANSLAGFLLPWAILSLLCFFRALEKRGPWDRGTLVSFLAFLVLAVGTLLTQSRSAVGVLTLVVLVRGAVSYSQNVRRGLLHLTIAAVCVGAVVAIGRVRGKFDEEFITGATTSLTYRAEYWAASVAMLRDHPWTGVGPGNFRSHYLRYKLPESSEEISDPHNWLLELAVTGGIPAAVLFLGFLVTAGLAGRSRRKGEHSSSPPTEEQNGKRPHVPLLLVTIAALMLARWVGGLETVPAIFLGGVWAGVFLLVYAHAGCTTGVDVRIALLGLLVHLLFNGGIQLPGVAIALWVLLATLDNPGRSFTVHSRPLSALAVLAYFGALVLVTRLHILPMLTSRAALAEGNRYFAGGAIEFAVDAYERATHQCRWNCSAWAALCRARVALAMNDSLDGPTWPLAMQAAQEWHRCDPASPWPCRDIALLWMRHATLSSNPRSWNEALRWIGEARARYPTDLGLAYLEARILWLSGHQQDAARAAARVLEQNDRCPHPDRKLTNAQVQNLKQWAAVRNK